MDFPRPLRDTMLSVLATGEIVMADDEGPEEENVDQAMKDAEEDPQTRWLAMPAIYCDDFIAAVWPGVVRLVFTEATKRDYYPFIRSSIVMPLETAKVLAEEILEKIREAEKETNAKLTKPETNRTDDSDG